MRIRVSTWLSGIVDEVRRKSPVPLQKRFETISRENDVTDVSTESPSSLDHQVQQESEVCTADNEAVPTKFWGAGNFLNKVNKSFDKFSLEQDNNIGGGGARLRALGKAKINEFYDKVRINKARYNMLKAKKMEEMSGGNSTADLSTENLDNITEDDVMSSSFSNPKDLTINSDNLDNTTDSDIIFNFDQPKPALGVIGRRSTSIDHTHRRSVVGCTKPKATLGNIGRSFSEQNDEDEDDDSFVLNERLRSCSLVHNDEANSTSDNNNASSSLPSFFGNNSLPVSPMPYCKAALSRERSFSENPGRRNIFLRDSSVQSDSSHCSSVESLLEARKPDPEAILINLGFGPVQSEDILSKIPKRFLKPSQVKGNDTEAFVRQQLLANHLHDHSVLGYRGLVGNPDVPPSHIVANIMKRFELNEMNRRIMDINMNRPKSAPPMPIPHQ